MTFRPPAPQTGASAIPPLGHSYRSFRGHVRTVRPIGSDICYFSSSSVWSGTFQYISLTNFDQDRIGTSVVA